jgi:hypothetical protein
VLQQKQSPRIQKNILLQQKVTTFLKNNVTIKWLNQQIIFAGDRFATKVANIINKNRSLLQQKSICLQK